MINSPGCATEVTQCAFPPDLKLLLKSTTRRKPQGCASRLRDPDRQRPSRLRDPERQAIYRDGLISLFELDMYYLSMVLIWICRNDRFLNNKPDRGGLNGECRIISSGLRTSVFLLTPKSPGISWTPLSNLPPQPALF